MDKKYKILIADDDHSLHELLIRGLSPNEFEIISAYDGKETMECIEIDRPDLVILDVIMPDKDGRDICRDIKKNPKTKNIKILMLSGRDDQSDRILALELGADDYETKPFSLKYLVGKIKAMCKKTQ